VIAAGLVFAGTRWLGLQGSSFAVVNLALVALWVALVILLVRRNREASALSLAERPAVPEAVRA
jgi:hypothetical protein